MRGWFGPGVHPHLFVWVVLSGRTQQVLEVEIFVQGTATRLLLGFNEFQQGQGFGSVNTGRVFTFQSGDGGEGREEKEELLVFLGFSIKTKAFYANVTREESKRNH